MFCKNCGNQLNDNANFCPKCGCRTNDNDIIQSNVNNNKTGSNSKKLFSYAFYLSLINAPLMLIIRLTCSKTRTAYGWRGEYAQSYIPGNIIAVMLLLLFGIIIASFVLKKESGVNDKKSNVKIIVSNVVSAIIGLAITLLQ